MVNKNKILSGYRDWSETYDTDKNSGIIKIIPAIAKLLDADKKYTHGLDLGCGTGKSTFAVADQADKVTGLDLSDEMLAVARKKNPLLEKIEFKKADITEPLDFSDNEFDFAISSLAICHVQDLDSFLGEIKRVLKPGGIFIFGDVFSQLKQRFTKMGHHDHFAKYRENKEEIWNMYSLEVYLEALKKHGFKVEDIVETQIDDELRGVIADEDVETNKGCRFCVIVKSISPTLDGSEGRSR